MATVTGVVVLLALLACGCWLLTLDPNNWRCHPKYLGWLCWYWAKDYTLRCWRFLARLRPATL